MINYATLAAGATIATTNELPSAGRQATEPNPFTELVKAAAKDGKRRDLPGRLSLVPFEGRKAACEAFQVIGKLHAAGRATGHKLAVRRFDGDATSCRVTFKVQK